MSLFRQLSSIAERDADLGAFLQGNLQSISDFSTSSFKTISAERDEIHRFVLEHVSSIQHLDYTKGVNRAFLSLLIDFCVRLNMFAAVSQISVIAAAHNIQYGRRVEAGLCIIYPPPIDNGDLIGRLEIICFKLREALQYEEDDNRKAVATLITFYAIAVRDTRLEFAQQAQRNIATALRDPENASLCHAAVDRALSVSLDNLEFAYESIQEIIDDLLSHGDSPRREDLGPAGEILIEQGTPYSEMLSHEEPSFKAVRNLCCRLAERLPNLDEIHHSLGRGVCIIENEGQMLSYMRSHGSAHEAKLLSAFQNFPFQSISTPIELYDWGCGQGVASMVFMELVSSHRYDLPIQSIRMIEPSKLSLMRAALHIKHFGAPNNLRTICKKIDALEDRDVASLGNTTHIHMFSNILDVDAFSLSSLLGLIERTQQGTNYFVCVSPYINDAKYGRIEAFCSYFQSRYETHASIGEWNNGKKPEDEYWCCNQKHRHRMCADHPTPCGCGKKWTRVVRVFRVCM